MVKDVVSKIASYGEYLKNDRIKPALFDLRIFVGRQLLGTRIIHVIGDSHTQPFALQYPFVVHHVGAATAYNLGKKNSTTGSKEKVAAIIRSLDPKKNVVLMVMGEIDCRIHIYKKYMESKKQASIDSLILDTISSYGEELVRIRASGVELMVLSPTPAAAEKNIYCYEYYAEFPMRAEITKRFANELEKYCVAHGLRYIDLYQSVVNKHGGVLPRYRADRVHLNSRIVPIVRSLVSRSR